jgi:hypothetical protein
MDRQFKAQNEQASTFAHSHSIFRIVFASGVKRDAASASEQDS